MKAPFLLSSTSGQATMCTSLRLNGDPQVGKANVQDLQRLSTSGGLERSYVMIRIRAKASESLAHVMPQINCQKADQVIYNMYMSQQHSV